MTRQAVRLVVTNSSDQVLILTSALSGNFKFPGGGVDPGESPEMAAIRELREESGLAIKASDLHFLGDLAEILSDDNPHITHGLKQGDVQQVKYYSVTVSKDPQDWH